MLDTFLKEMIRLYTTAILVQRRFAEKGNLRGKVNVTKRRFIVLMTTLSSLWQKAKNKKIICDFPVPKHVNEGSQILS